MSLLNKVCALVAQLDRASGYGPEGLGFESLQACHFFYTIFSKKSYFNN